MKYIDINIQNFKGFQTKKATTDTAAIFSQINKTKKI